ncbi:MAG TPA: carboxypeptidase-like regulatory domain-containing protein [Terracidiphilus sp.]|jgi:hypothetical protein
MLPRVLAIVVSSCASALLVLPATAQTACLHGRVANTSGDPVAQARVTLASESGAVRSLLSAADGAFQVCDLAAGQYRITAAVPGLSSEEQVQSLAAGSSQPLDIVLRDTPSTPASGHNVQEFHYSATPDAELPDTPSAAHSSASRPHGEVKAMWGSGLAGQSGLNPQQFPLSQLDASIGGDLESGRTAYFARFDSFGVDSQTLLASLAAAQARNAQALSVNPLLVTATSFNARLDHRFSSRDTFYSRYDHNGIAASMVTPAHGDSPQKLADTRRIRQDSIVASNTVALSPRTMNETRAQFIATEAELPPGAQQAGVQSSLPTTHRDRVFEAANNVYRQAGGETLKLGGDFMFNQMNLTFLESTARSMLSQSSHDTGLYVMGEHRVRPNLLLTSGLRYQAGPLSGFRTQKNDLAPQVGFAWSPSSHTVLRGGGGMYYDQSPIPGLAGSADGSAGNLQNSARLTGPLPSGTSFAVYDPAIQRSYVQTANLGIEQQLTAHTSISADYQFARGQQLAIPLMQSATMCASAAACRAGNTFRAAESGSGAESNYHGFTVALAQEPTRWSSYKVGYSYASADSSGMLGKGSYLSDLTRSLSFNGGLHTSAEPAGDFWQHLTRGIVLSSTGSYTARSEFTGINFIDTNARLTKTLAWGQHYRLDALAESFNSFERTSAPFMKSVAGMGERYVNVYSTFRAVASMQGPTSTQFGLRLGF